MRSFTMPILLPTSSFKTTATVFIAGVFTVAAAVTFTVPSASHFVASRFPIIYDNTVFLLKPPYLYLVINCIIVSIVATSKLTQKSSPNIDDDSDFSQVVTPPVTVVPVPSDIHTAYSNVVHAAASDYTGFVENDAPNDPTVEDVQKFPEGVAEDKLTIDDEEDHPPQPETEKPKPSSDSPEKPKRKSDSPEASILKNTRKPPRSSQQKSLKSSSEAGGGGGGNKKSSLGVTKPLRRQDTLETTWKKITEGRSTPLTKHLTKSDTWQERSHVQSPSSSSSSAKQKKKEKLTKSENLNDINAPTEEEEETLRKKPSPGQEELNRRVEAFIKKFNEEMRLQRLESLAKYNEMMVNGGTRL